MKHPYDLDDFESFLSEQSEKLRMYPEDRVWRNIQQSLHGKDRWPALTFAAFLTGAFITILLFFIHPDKELFNMPSGYAYNNINADQGVVNGVDASMNAENTLQPESFVQEQNQRVTAVPRVNTKQNLSATDLSNSIAIELGNNNEQLVETDSDIAPAEFNGKAAITTIPVLIATNKFTTIPASSFTSLAIKTSHLQPAANVDMVTATSPSFTDVIFTQPNKESISNTTLEEKAGIPVPKVKTPKSGRLALQFYATPSVSYRYLIDDKRQVLEPGSGPFAPFAVQQVNAFVRQKPKLGLEAGTAILYSLSDNFRIKTGLQINYRQFSISAYNTATEPARLDLDNGYGIRSFVQLTNISNQSGYREVELNNSFLQLALPIGFDLKIADVNKVSFYVAAAGQLTYQLKSNNYLISADFKNFVKNTDLDRKLNVNTAVEAFATFKTGNVTWQAGPQIRYQLLPGSKNSYLIREHLIDYGMKVGIIKTLK